MELFLIPLVGITGLYFIKKQDEKKKTTKNFTKQEDLPNVNVPDPNYSDIGTDLTSKLININKYDNQFAYTDKYFTDPIKTTRKTKTKSDVPIYRSVTGETDDINYFQHNNMVPFFGSKSHSNNAANSKEATLDKYTGAGSQFNVKKESSSMFHPSTNNERAYGMPSTTDFVQSRQNPSSKKVLQMLSGSRDGG